MSLRLVALGFGVAFGFLLGWTRMVDYDVVHDMLLLKSPYIFLVMGGAMMTAGVGIRVLRALGARSVLDGTTVSWSTTKPTRNHVVGAAVFGLGWALAGTCPGPALAQLGSGHLAAVFTVTGLLGGVALRGQVAKAAVAPPPTATVAGL